MKNRIFTVMLISILAIFSCSASAFAEYAPPDPVGYVNDFAQMLTPENKTKLESLLTQLNTKTSAEVAVVTLTELDGNPIENVALSIGRTWGVGARKNHNGLVILVARNERKMRIEVGYGLEGFLTDSQAGRIRDQYMLPYFRSSKYNEGIVNGTVACAQAIAKGYGVTLDGNYEKPKGPEKPNPLVTFLFIALFIFLCIKYPEFMMGLFLAGLLGGRHRYGGGGFGGGFGGFSGGGGFGGGGASGGW